jgi:periplasmic divalent cation tolerance protein
MPDILVVLMTAPTHDVAESIVNTLVTEKLIACGNITVPVSSIYRWQGVIERASEVMVVMKTTTSGFNALQGRVRELHPYDVPELIALRVEKSLDAYSQWIRASVKS